jgi:hypothetical protein
VLLSVGWEHLEEVTCLHSYTFVFSLQEIEENVTFDNLLKPDNGNCRINQGEFDGFSFINNGVPQ